MTALRKTAVAAMLVVLIGGCSDETIVGTSGDEATGTTVSGGDALPADRDALPLGLGQLRGVDGAGRITDAEALVESAQQVGLSPQQVAAFEDGDVDYAEHEALTRLTIQCLRDAGFDASETGVSEGIEGVPTLSFRWGGPGSDTSAALDVADFCEQYHSLPAELIYIAMNGPPAEEVQRRVDELFVTFGECLRDAGVDGLPDLEEYDSSMQEELLQYLDDPRHDCAAP